MGDEHTHGRANAVRYALKVDSNQTSVISALEAAGCLVDVISQPVDLLVGVNGKWMLMEVKNPKGKNKVTPQQTRFFDKYEGYPWALVDGPEAALRAIGVVK